MVVDLGESHLPVARDQTGIDLALALQLDRQATLWVYPEPNVQRPDGEEELRDPRVDPQAFGPEKAVDDIVHFKANRLDALNLLRADLAMVAGGPEPFEALLRREILSPFQRFGRHLQAIVLLDRREQDGHRTAGRRPAERPRGYPGAGGEAG